MNPNPSMRSGKLFESGFFCAESVLLAIAEYLGIESEFIPGIATGFCSGISRTSGLCGAVSGGIMALGLVSGRTSQEDAVDKNYRDVQKLLNLVDEKFGATNCAELLGLDLGTEEGREAFVAQDKKAQCIEMTEAVTGLVQEIIIEGQPA